MSGHNDHLLDGRYRVVETIRVGSFDRIHAIDEHSDDQKEVYVARLTDGNMANPKTLDTFAKHVSVLEKLSGHAGIIDVLGKQIPPKSKIGKVEDVYFVTEYLPFTLSHSTVNDLSTEAKVSLLAKLLQALQVMHDAGYMHLRLSPDVVGLSENHQELSLLDLGNCRPFKRAAVVSDAIARYASPELYQGTQRLGGYTDVYSVGHMFYEHLANDAQYKQFFGDIIRESDVPVRDRKWINWHQGTRTLPPLDSLNSLVGPVVSQAVSSMVEKNIAQRPQHAGAALQALTNHSIDSGEPMNNDLTGDFPEPAGKKSSNLLLLTGIALVSSVAIVAAYFFFLMPKAPPKPTVAVEKIETLKSQVLERKAAALALVESAATNAGIQQADTHYNTAEALMTKDERVLAVDSFKKSGHQYTSVVEEVGARLFMDSSAHYVSLTERARELGVLNVDEFLDYEFSSPDSWEGYSPALKEINEVTKSLAQGISTNPRMVTIGSSPEDINDALKLCKGFSVQCHLSWYEDESERTVSLKPYLMDEKEVTVSDFAKYIAETGVVTEVENRNLTGRREGDMAYSSENTGLFWYNAYKKSDGADHEKNDPTLGTVLFPVVHLTRLDASRYCRFVDKRLPTGAEWEHAARGSERVIYPWGNSLENLGVFRGEQTNERFFAVGSFPKSESGLYDLAGGVSEWTISDTEVVFQVLDEEGKKTSVQQTRAIVKGASRFDENHANLRLGVRRYELIDYSGNDVGVRCASDMDEWPG